MSYAGYLKDLLRPMGVYRLEDSINAAELESIGAALDAVAEKLEEVHRQADLTVAGEAGLAKVERLFVRRPMTENPEQMRKAVAALLRIGGDSFTQKALNDTLTGCGLRVAVSETEVPQSVAVHFPDVAGIPEGFEQIRAAVEEILPCHLAVEYLFWYINWDLLERRFGSWESLEAQNLTWTELEKMVE